MCCGDDGVPSFDRIRYRRHAAAVFLYAFNLIELNGDDLRRDPLEVRKATLASVLTKAALGLSGNSVLCPRSVPSMNRFIRSPAADQNHRCENHTKRSASKTRPKPAARRSATPPHRTRSFAVGARG